jgi:hypothetical protein
MLAPYFDSVVLIHREKLEESLRFQRAAQRVLRAKQRNGEARFANSFGGKATTYIDLIKCGMQQLSRSVGYILTHPFTSFYHLLQDVQNASFNQICRILSFHYDIHPSLIETKLTSKLSKLQKTISAPLSLLFNKSNQYQTIQHLQTQLHTHSIKTTTSISHDTLADCDVLLIGTNSSKTLIDPHMLKRNAILLDISVPSNLPEDLSCVRSDVEAFVGGYMRLPLGQQVDAMVFKRDYSKDEKSEEFEKSGGTYACLSEALVLGLAGTRTSVSRETQKISTSMSLLSFELLGWNWRSVFVNGRNKWSSVGPLSKSSVVSIWSMALRKDIGFQLGGARRMLKD